MRSEVGVKKSGFGLGGGSLPMVVPKKSASQDTGTSYSNTAAVTSIESKNGGVAAAKVNGSCASRGCAQALVSGAAGCA